MNQNFKKSKDLWIVLGRKTLRSFDNLLHYQVLLFELSQKPSVELDEKDILTDLVDTAYTIPYEYIKATRDKYAELLEKLTGEGYKPWDEEKTSNQKPKKVSTVQRKKTSPNKYQNGKMNTLEANKKRHYRIIAKRKACKISRKFVQLQNSNKSRNREIPQSDIENVLNKTKNHKNSKNDKLANLGETSQTDTGNGQCKMEIHKNFKYDKLSYSGKTSESDMQDVQIKTKNWENSKHLKLANSGETSLSDTENVRTKNFSRRQRFKRKAEEVNDESSLISDNENSVSINKTPSKKVEYIKKMKHTHSSFATEPVKFKHLIVKLNDFMIDLSVDSDKFVAQYKQLYTEQQSVSSNKGNEEIVDASDDNEVHSDEGAESDYNSDGGDDDENNGGGINNEDNINKMNKSDDMSNSDFDCFLYDEDIDQEDDEYIFTLRGPQTPPLPSPDFISGPQTPPPPSPDSIRGPHTPPSPPPHYIWGSQTPSPDWRRGPCTPRTPPEAPTSDSEDSLSESTTS